MPLHRAASCADVHEAATDHDGGGRRYTEMAGLPLMARRQYAATPREVSWPLSNAGDGKNPPPAVGIDLDRHRARLISPDDGGRMRLERGVPASSLDSA